MSSLPCQALWMSNEQAPDTAIRLIAAAMFHARLLSQFFYLGPDRQLLAQILPPVSYAPGAALHRAGERAANRTFGRTAPS